MSYGDGSPVPREMVEALERANGKSLRRESREILACPWCWVSAIGRDGVVTREPAQATRRFFVAPCIRHGGTKDPLDPWSVQGVDPIPLFRLHEQQPPGQSQVGKDWSRVARARDFDGHGAWGCLADGSWDIVVPVTIRLRGQRWMAQYGGMSRPCKYP
jgi:hypothetical protein